MKSKLFLALLIMVFAQTSHGQNLLAIPDTLSGTNFSLTLHDTSNVFYPGYTTSTFGVNAAYLGPTLLLNQGDSISIEVHNQLMDTTTIHWHGMHVSALNDGGPHITIAPGTTWNPRFKVRDHAAMYWYHPHLHMMTNLHATLGAAGMIIVRDTLEAALTLPRSYGVDDFPLAIQSKCFDATKQIIVGNASDSVMMVNGTIDAYLPTPAQVVRFRLLNASSERVYYLGLEGNMSFYQIGSDGGLLDAPVSLTRLRLATGERAEILVDFGGMTGQTVRLMSYASELPNAIYGAAQPGMGPGQTIPGYASNPLNGADFEILTLNVIAPTSNPVTTIPNALVLNTPYDLQTVNTSRTLTFTPTTMGPTAIQGPFLINNTSFDMGVINYSLPLGNVELWTLSNQSPIAHPFHIHNIAFYVTDINGSAPPLNHRGRKDVVLVPAMQTVQFITKFEDFCDSMAPYMYHCHLLPHEDEGMMGQFLVTCPTTVAVESSSSSAIVGFPNPTRGLFTINAIQSEPTLVTVLNCWGEIVFDVETSGQSLTIDLSQKPAGIYFVRVAASTETETIKLMKF